MMSKTGLILEGGGMRGMYTAGILDVFMEHGIRFDGVIGVSAGAIHACSYMSEQKGRDFRYYKKYCTDPRFVSFKSLIKTGDIVGADFCYHQIPDVLDPYDHDAFLKNKTEFYVTCTNLHTGMAEYPRVTDMREQIDLVRASASLPYVSRIVRIDGKKYLDGGCTDSIPVDAFRKMGFEKTVLILTRPDGYERKKEHSILARLRYWRYPKFVKSLLSRHDRYNATKKEIAELGRAGKVFVICPKEELNIGRLESDPAQIQRVYDIGYEDGEKILGELTVWLSNTGKQEEKS